MRLSLIPRNFAIFRFISESRWIQHIQPLNCQEEQLRCLICPANRSLFLNLINIKHCLLYFCTSVTHKVGFHAVWIHGHRMLETHSYLLCKVLAAASLYYCAEAVLGVVSLVAKLVRCLLPSKPRLRHENS